MRYLKYLLGGMLTAALVACGGGGGNPGTPSSGSGSSSGSTNTTSSVSDFYISTDKSTINNSGSDSAKLTVIAVNANNNIVVGATVAVATDNNTVFAPTSGAVTDANGSYSGTISIGASKADRDVTATVTINGKTKKVLVRIAGSKITLQATPSAPTPGQAVVLTATLVDYSNNPIAGSVVSFGGSIPALQGQSASTASSGVATKSFTAPSASGVYTVTASGSGVQAADYQLQVFASAGAVPAAVIPSGALPSLSASPNVLSVNASGFTTNKSTLKFLFLDASNNPIPNVRVRFDDTTTGLPKVGSSLSTGSATSYTDVSGSTTSQYIAGQNSSPTNGVTVRACYSAVDFTSATDCPASLTASLTVAGQALAISIGNDNLLEAGSGTYIKTFTVTVADSAGRPVSGAAVDISVDLSHFGKGQYAYPFRDGSGAAIPSTQWLSVVPTSLIDSYPSVSTIPSTRGERVWCANEDTNRNGSVDPGENVNGSVDSNGQATLEPRKSDLLVRYADPAVTTTNASGILLIKVEYSQRFATWLAYRVRVTTNVAGSQGMAEGLFLTTFIDGDQTNGSFLVPPYGSGACNSPS
ncbi:hypothetical protein [Variovorax sp. HJSM1_2]|uniref:hypothetical protein n=1 Tax=Variovorax sp. HJSM1_2 TaxID=3366263 RepID=UPI003BE36DEA